MPEVAPPLDTSSNFGAVIGKTIADEIPGAMAASKARDESLKAAGDKTIASLETAQKKREAMPIPTPPNLGPPPEMQHTKPVEQWGSLAMGLAMLGSAFTRQPLLNSLNSAAAVMNAYNKSDADSFKQNFDRWKAQNDYAIQTYKWQHDFYKDAIDLIESQPANALAILKVKASAMGDDPLKRLTEAGNLASTATLLQQRAYAAQQAEVTAAEVKREGERVVTINTARADQAKAKELAKTDPAAAAALAADAQQRIDGALQQAKDDDAARGKHVPGKELSPSKEIAVLDKDGNVVSRIAARESTTEAGKWVRSDDGKPVPIPPGGKIDVGAAANAQIIGSRESTLLQRQLGAGVQAVKAIKDVVMLPSSASGGYFAGRGQKDGLMNAAKETLTHNVTSQEVQAYQALMPGMSRSLAFIDSQGLQPGVKFTDSFNAEMLKEGDKEWTKLLKLARQREIVEAGMETLLTNNRIGPEQKKKAEEVMRGLAEAVPWTPADVIGLMSQKNPRMTLRQMGVAKTEGAEKPAAAAAAPGGASKAPPAAAIDHLKSNPTDEMKANFDDVFGPGAAAKALGP